LEISEISAGIGSTVSEGRRKKGRKQGKKELCP
jgi:hypothetical protein